MGLFGDNTEHLERSFNADITRQMRKMSALENRIRLIEETIGADPELAKKYAGARARMAERKLKDDLSGSGW